METQRSTWSMTHASPASPDKRDGREVYAGRSEALLHKITNEYPWQAVTGGRHAIVTDHAEAGFHLHLNAARRTS